jgi:hypothetical protein
MEEEFYCVLKLSSGEEIFSLISVDDTPEDPLIILQNPVKMETFMDNENNTFMKVKPFMQLTSEDMFFIRRSSVITMVECKDEKLIEIYESYLFSEMSENEKTSSHEVKMSPKMGYLSSVEDARKKFEKIFKGS